MFQADLAKHLGVDRISVQNWERNVYSPAKTIIPRIIAWLGYDPNAAAAIPKQGALGGKKA